MNLKEKTLEKFIDDYKTKQPIYENFAKFVETILKNILKNNEIKHQIVNHRSKEMNSLQKKIINNKKLLELNSVIEIDDLAGCRVIFYIERDIERFRYLIYKEFDVKKDNLKYSDTRFNGRLLVVQLNKNRHFLAKYDKFTSMKCEIQLTTVLYHAWSEISHGTIYKPPEELYNFDNQTFSLFEKRLSRVMKEHIKEAQYEFDFISYQLENLRKGKQVFGNNFLENTIHSKSNIELYGNLTLLHKYIEEFGDKTPKEFHIIKIIKSALKKSKKQKIKPIKMANEYLEDFVYTEVAGVCLDILNELKYFYVEEVFDLLIKLSLVKETEIKKKSLEILSHLSQYKINVLKKMGYYPQLLILGNIEKWNTEQLIERIESITEISEKLLSPSFEGITRKNYKTIAFQFGALKKDDNLKKIRNRTISMLKKFYAVVKDRKQKQIIVQALQTSTRLPDRGEYDNDMEDMVLGNTNEIIDYYISIIPDSNFEITQEIEEDIYWLIQRIDKNKLPRIKDLITLLSSIKEYEIFKTLVGHYYYTFDIERLEPEKMNWKEKEARRKTKIQEFIYDISEENYEEWEQRMISIIKNYSFPEDQGEFLHFNFFLNELGKQKPEIAYNFLIEIDDKIEPFLANLIAGIWKSPLKPSVEDLVSKWVKEGKHLSECARVFDFVGEIDESLINENFNKAKEIENKDTQNKIFNNIVRSIVKNYPKNKNIKNLFIKCIREMTKNKNCDWIYNEWNNRASILRSLTVIDVDAIFENLLILPNINHAEEVLTLIVEKYPKKIITFFYRRFLTQKKKKREDNYDAIPYELPLLNKPLSENAEIIIIEILTWFNKKDSLLHWKGSHLIKSIFPTFNRILEKELIKLIKSKNVKKIRIVFNILDAYRGEAFLYNICKEIIKKYPQNKDYRYEIFRILSQIEGYSGEYGIVEELNKKKEEIQNWKEDENEAIQVFVKKYKAYLNKRILHEKKQADEDIELRKREFED